MLNCMEYRFFTAHICSIERPVETLTITIRRTFPKIRANLNVVILILEIFPYGFVIATKFQDDVWIVHAMV